MHHNAAGRVILITILFLYSDTACHSHIWLNGCGGCGAELPEGPYDRPTDADVQQDRQRRQEAATNGAPEVYTQ